MNDSTKNKITVNMYDRHLMPLVEDLYFTDHTNQVRAMKAEGGMYGVGTKTDDDLPSRSDK